MTSSDLVGEWWELPPRSRELGYTMVRLKEFGMGGADCRHESHASLSLEDIQARHQRMLRVHSAADAAFRGELPGYGEVIDVEADDPAPPAPPPTPPLEI